MPKTKDGEKITWKEFMGRWGEGIEEITPIQKIKTQIIGTRISLVGIFLGICVTLYGWENLWWVAIILIGALINTGVQYLGIVQQRNTLLKHEEDCEEMSLDDLMREDEVMTEDEEELNNQEVKKST